MPAHPLNLPLVSDAPASKRWEVWHPLPGWDSAELAPEPDAPQGEYGGDVVADLGDLPNADRPVELLAPAGGPDAGYAAFHHGADAIYLGLKKFSARAEAENFTLAEVDEITAYAHSLTPSRRVFVTVNTVVKQEELAELVDDLAALDAIGVDALIVQDFGVSRIVKEHFPRLELHGSTQLAVHNRAGAETLRRLGFTRVVLARELTAEEVHDVTAATGVETEVFVHGALCYSYSGLCLFSAQTLGRSGNRGKCAYSCRDSFDVTGAPTHLKDGERTKRDPRRGFPFSMKDLALPDHMPALRAAGVSCFKIEGRKKSPLYVATTTHFYRDLLDGNMHDDDRRPRESELQTVFSRPWTKLFVQSHKDKEVADRDTVGHRGTRIGSVSNVTASRVEFVTDRPLERHDGLQIDLPRLGKPFGFPVDRLWIVGPRGKKREAVTSPAGMRVEVGLPPEHPEIPVGAPVYCSSSQEVKRRYKFDRPKPGLYRTRRGFSVRVEIGEGVVTATARCGDTLATAAITGEFPVARDLAALTSAVTAAFDKVGDTCFELEGVTVENPHGCFVPVSRINQLRRDVMAALESECAKLRKHQIAAVKSGVAPPVHRAAANRDFTWSVKVDRVDAVGAFEDVDWLGVDDLIVDVARDHSAELFAALDVLAGKIGRGRIRLAVPPVVRKWEDRGLVAKIHHLLTNGWNRWEAGNVGAWGLLGVDPNDATHSGIDLTADWSLYAVNRMAIRQLEGMGCRRVTLSPEDGKANMASLLAEFADRAAVIVYQDTPLFIAESCAYANLIGGCPGKANCSFESMQMESSHGEKVTALDYHCRTIVLNHGPYCLSPRLGELAKMGAKHLRADFIYRRYDPVDVRDRWRTVRAGMAVPGGHAANFNYGLL